MNTGRRVSPLLAAVAALLLTTGVVVAQSSKGASASKASASQAQDKGVFYVSDKDYQEHQKLEADLAKSVSTQEAGKEKKCHIEYRNCWTDYEWRCPSPMYPGSTVHCEKVPVRRCGKPETICN